MDKNYEVREVPLMDGEEVVGYTISVQFKNEDMAGYFLDWYEGEGREQFDAAIIDL